jgi:hypothetical protein
MGYWLPPALLFVVGRGIVLSMPQPTSDVGVYARFAREALEASRHNMTVHEYHTRAIQTQIDCALRAGNLAGSLEEYKNIEYPPLALTFMQIPAVAMGMGSSGEEFATDFERRYVPAFRILLAFLDWILFACLALLVRDRAKDGLAVYAIATFLLWHLLYDRLDLALAVLLVLALALLTGPRHYAWSFAVLALAINFKLIPLLLAPVWVLGSLSGRDLQTPGRALVALATRSGLLCLLTAACFLPFYRKYGDASLGFLSYHRDRGLEIGSLYSSLPLAGQLLTHPLKVEYSHGSINLVAADAGPWPGLAPWIGVCALGGGIWLLYRHAQRLATPACGQDSRSRLAQLYPGLFAAYALLFLMLFILTSKVFSPQYLLWLAPFMTLLSLPRPALHRLFCGFLLVCLLSTLLVPFLFLMDLYDPGSQTLPRGFHGPTARLSAVVIARNLAFAGLTIYLAGLLYRLQARGLRDALEPATSAWR